MNACSAACDEPSSPLWVPAVWALRPLQLGLAFPSILYLGAMTVFLFRPPDLYSFYADRVAFAVLAFLVVLRMMALGERIPFVAGLSLPMLGLTALAVARMFREPFDAQNWSLVAGKFIVPFTLFHLARIVFRGAAEGRHFAIFVVLALGYLILTAIAFLADAPSLIFPRFILDANIGFHADRARGPFLQAVANGMSLNLLGILALALWDARKTFVLLFWLMLPFAVLATMTRAIWISFAVSTVALGFRLRERRLQIACVVLIVAGLLAGVSIGLDRTSLKHAIWERTAEPGPVNTRLAVYQAGWAMFKERPLTGWPAGVMYGELARRMPGYRLRTYYVHNTYLALLVEFGLPGLALYAMLVVNLFRLARPRNPRESRRMQSLRRVWPVLLAVYLFNAFFVDMAYQFVIGLLFTVAGILSSAQEASA